MNTPITYTYATGRHYDTEQVLVIELVSPSEFESLWNVTDASRGMKFNVETLLTDINDECAICEEVLRHYDGGDYNEGHLDKVQPSRQRALEALKRDYMASGEEVCVRLFGLSEDVWLDTATIAENGGVYVYLESLLLDEDYETFIKHRDYDVVDYDGDLTRAFYVGCGDMDFELFEQANDMDLANEVIAKGISLGIQLDNIESAYCGEFDSDEEFAMEYVDSTGMLAEVPESLKAYFDYEHYARDLMMDHMVDSGYYFRNC